MNQHTLADTINKTVIWHTINELRKLRANSVPAVSIRELDGVDSADLLHMRHGVEFLYRVLTANDENNRTRDWVSTAGLFARKGSS